MGDKMAREYARAVRVESRDALWIAAMAGDHPPTIDIERPFMDRSARETFRRHVERAADRAIRHGGMVDLPATTLLLRVAYEACGDPAAAWWRHLVEAIRCAALELDRTIDFTRPA